MPVTTVDLAVSGVNSYSNVQNQAAGVPTHGAMGDAGDGTYHKYNASGDTPAANVVFDITDYTLPAGNLIDWVRAVVRIKGDAPMGYFNVTLEHPSYAYTFTTSPTASGTITTVTCDQAYQWQTATSPFPVWDPITSLLNSMRLRIAHVIGGAGSKGYVYEAKVQVGVMSIPNVTSVVCGPTITDTLQPTATWSQDDPGNRYQAKIFSAAQYGAGGFDPSTSPSTWESGDVESTVRQVKAGVPLVNGTTYRTYVRVARKATQAKAYTGWSPWAYAQYTISLAAPSTPTNVKPLAAATVTTDLPQLEAKLITGHWTTQRAEWQLARDAAFTTSVRSVLEPEIDLDAGGIHSDVVGGSAELFQGTWYLRARSVNSAGVASAWSAAQSFTVAHPPATASLNPTGNVTADFGGSGVTGLSWQFTDPSPTDTQTAWQVIIERNDTSALVLDTGKQTGSTQSASVTIPGAVKDIQLRWKLRVWDSDDVAGAYSSYQLFYIRDKPTVTLVSPVDGGQFIAPAPAVQWGFTAGGGRTQAMYRVIVSPHGGVTALLDTGFLVDSTPQHAFDEAVLTLGSSYDFAIFVRDSVGMEASATGTAQAQWLPPETVPFTVDASSYDTAGHVTVSWNDDVQDSNFLEYRVYRRLVSSASWTLIGTVASSPTMTFNDYTVAAQTPVEYAVVQLADRYGAAIESARVATPLTVTSATYWLIIPGFETDSVPLRNVTAETFSEEYETAEIKLLGRGRRVEYGARHGRRGSVTAQIWDIPGRTARDQRLALEAMKARRVPVLMRNPFGDIWKVATSDMTIERTPGVGPHEYATLTFDFMEVN